MSMRPWVILGVSLLIYSFILACVVRGSENNTEILIEKLDSAKYIDREKASKEIASKMNFDLYLHLKALKPPSLESIRRIEMIVGDYENYIYKKWDNSLKIKFPSEDSEYPWICLSSSWNHKCTYIILARSLGTKVGESPHYMDFRVATKLWLTYSINVASKKALLESKNENEFFTNMNTELGALVEKIHYMVMMEDNYCRSRGVVNSLRRVWGLNSK